MPDVRINQAILGDIWKISEKCQTNPTSCFWRWKEGCSVNNVHCEWGIFFMKLSLKVQFPWNGHWKDHFHEIVIEKIVSLKLSLKRSFSWNCNWKGHFLEIVIEKIISLKKFSWNCHWKYYFLEIVNKKAISLNLSLKRVFPWNCHWRDETKAFSILRCKTSNRWGPHQRAENESQEGTFFIFQKKEETLKSMKQSSRKQENRKTGKRKH